MSDHRCCSFELDRFPYNRPRLKGLTSGCQFSADEGALVEHDGRFWCELHLPATGKIGWDKARIAKFNACVERHIASHLEGPFIDLSGVVFPGEMHFSDERMGNPLHVLTGRDEIGRKGKSRKLPAILFIKSVFTKTAYFLKITFADTTHFDECTAIGQLIFWDCVFKDDVHFDGAAVWDLNLAANHFGGNAYLRAAKLGSCTFSESYFSGRCWMQNSELKGYCRFTNAVFCGEVSLDCNNESKLTLASLVDFSGSEFFGRACFNNRQFEGTTDFSDTIFHVAPEFHGCKLHQDTNFLNAQFLDTGNAIRREVLGVYPSPVDAARAYRTLKLAMEGARARHEEARFFALEQRSLRVQRAIPLHARLLSLAYEWSSDYGQSILRPICALLITLAVFLFIYLAIFFPLSGVNLGWVAFSARMALSNIFKPFELFGSRAVSELLTDTYVVSAQVPVSQYKVLALGILGASQTILSFGLLTLLLLAVRRRFKID